jgi:threonine aldolase
VALARVSEPPERDALAIRRACERTVSGELSAWSTPRATLDRLADRIPPGEPGDMYGRGELVERFEARIAELLGKEAAAFMPTGTMAQQIALRIHADRRSRRIVAFHPTAHLELHEESAYRRLHALDAVLVGGRHDVITLADLEAIAEPVAALLLELPQREIGGLLPEWDELAAQAEWARGRGAALHMDGARLWEAAPYYGRGHDEISKLFDTVYVSFYKGLGGIAGCALAGPAELIAEARRWQIRHGGRLASFSLLVAAAELGLERFLPQMPARYQHAVAIARELAAVDGVEVVPDLPQTPMMHVFLHGDRDRLVEAALDVAEEQRIWLFRGLDATAVPTRHMLELTVADAGLQVEPAEVAALFATVLARAAA